MKTPTRIIPQDRIKGLRFGQLLLAALMDGGYLKQIPVPTGDINDEKYGITDMAYLVSGVDLFYLENEQLEEILQNFLSKE
jgi:hypothetical protein